MRSYHVDTGAGLAGLSLREHEPPHAGAGQVVVAVRAASLSFRELMVLRGDYLLPVKPDVAPVSDGAGEVVAVGEGVTRVRIGDRVMGTLFPRWLDGPCRREDAAQLGGSLDSMLTELALLSEDALVEVPAHLSFEEASTLPCVAVTAWNAITGGRRLLPGETAGTLDHSFRSVAVEGQVAHVGLRAEARTTPIDPGVLFASGATVRVVSRFADGKGTNPEELIAAGHAGCFSMALSYALTERGHPPRSVETSARVRLRSIDGVPTIDRIELETVGDVAGIDERKFRQVAEHAKAGCAVSRALAGRPEIVLRAHLAG